MALTLKFDLLAKTLPWAMTFESEELFIASINIHVHYCMLAAIELCCISDNSGNRLCHYLTFCM